MAVEHEALRTQLKKIYHILSQRGTTTSSETEFVEDNIDEYDVGAPTGPPNWIAWINAKRQSYGISGIEVIKVEKPYGELFRMNPALKWYEYASKPIVAHLSEDNMYYVVAHQYNSISKKFLDNDKLNLKGTFGIFEDEEFLNNTKELAFQRLAVDLAKETPSAQDIRDYSFISNVGAEAWYVPTRPTVERTTGIPATNQPFNLILKVQFDRGWVESLPDVVTVEPSESPHTVILKLETLEKDLNNLKTILEMFHSQVSRSQTIVQGFDASCESGKTSRILTNLNKILSVNGKDIISDTNKGAIQLGFSAYFDLEYVAFSETPDCLCGPVIAEAAGCGEKNVSGYVLKYGIKLLNSTPPMDSRTTNALMYYLPQIIQKYGRYLSSPKNIYLFGSEQSWLKFIESFTFPKATVVRNTSLTKEQKLANSLMMGFNASNIMGNSRDRLSRYMDPGSVLDPSLKERLLGNANAQTEYIGDNILYDALMDEFDWMSKDGMEKLYDRLLGNIPIFELVKIAVNVLFKCLAPDETKLFFCRTIFAMLTEADIRQKVIPCLQERGWTGAIGALEDQMAGRSNFLYEEAQKRLGVNELPSRNNPNEVLSDSEKRKLDNLYCSDKDFQKMIGKPLDDYSDEFENLMSGEYRDQICHCVLEAYPPISEVMDTIMDVAEDITDLAQLFEKNRAALIEKHNALPLKKMEGFDFGVFLTNKIKGFGKAFGEGLQAAIEGIIFAAVLLVVEQIKKELFGGLLSDMCGPGKFDPFGRLGDSIVNMIANSHLHVDKDFQTLKNQLSATAERVGVFANGDDLLNLFDDISGVLSPSETQLLLKGEPCANATTDDVFKTIQQVLDKPGYEELKNGISPEASGLSNVSTFASFFSAIGALVDQTVIDAMLENWREQRRAIADFCNPLDGSAAALLAEKLSADDIKSLLAKDKEDLLKDIAKMLPLLDTKQLEDMMPPVFCGPCNPKKIGMKPIMPSQTHPSQDYLSGRVQKAIYSTIETAFDNDISTYKPVILGEKGKLKDILTVLADNASGIEQELETNDKYKYQIMGNDESGVLTPSERHSKYAPQLLMEKMSSYGDEQSTAATDKYVAPKLRNAITEAAKLVNLHLQEENYIVFKYSLEVIDDDVVRSIYLVLNFTGADVEFYDTNIPVRNNQIKIIVWDHTDNTAIYQYPQIDSPNETVLNFNIEDFKNNIFAYLEQEDSINVGVVTPNLYGKIYGKTMEHIFESVFVKGLQSNLFEREIFQAIPLTNAEIKAQCERGAGLTPILDIPAMLDDVDNLRQQLECSVSRWASPDATEIANLYGVFKLMFKVIITEEFLKNIFSFALMKISDVIKSGAYMQLVVDNVFNSASKMSSRDGYAILKENALKIVTSRQLAGEEVVPVDPNTGVAEIVSDPDEAIKILIAEAAQEVTETLDERVQTFEWRQQFDVYKQLDNLTDLDLSFIGRYLEYCSFSKSVSPLLVPLQGDSVIPEFQHEQFNIADLDNNDPDNPLAEFKNDFGGGLYREPYIRIESKFKKYTLHSAHAATHFAMIEFWDKFQTAFEDLDDDEYKYNSVVATASTQRMQAIIDQINLEKGDGYVKNSPSFQLFFNTFFNPLGNDWSTKGINNVLQRIVSSRDAVKCPPNIASDKKYYYWEKQSDFVEPQNMTTDGRNWWNRGRTSIEIVDRDYSTIKIFSDGISGIFTAEEYFIAKENYENAVEAFDDAVAADGAAQKELELAVPWDAGAKAGTGGSQGNYFAGGEKFKDFFVEGGDTSYHFINVEDASCPDYNPDCKKLGLRTDCLANSVDKTSYPSDIPLFHNDPETGAWSQIYIERNKQQAQYNFPDCFSNGMWTKRGWLKKKQQEQQITNDARVAAHAAKQAAEEVFGPIEEAYLASGVPDTFYESVSEAIGNVLSGGFFGSNSSYSYNPQNPVRAGSGFWRLLNNIFLQSPIDQWFDITPGMRLNLVVSGDDLPNDVKNAFNDSNSDNQRGINNLAEDKTFFVKGLVNIPNVSSLSLPIAFWEMPGSDEVNEDTANDIKLKKLVDTLKPDIANPSGIYKYPLTDYCKLVKNSKNNNQLIDFLKLRIAEEVSQSPLFEELLPLKEITTTAALIYRFYMEEAYPELNTTFYATKQLLNRCIAQMVSAIDKDYAFTDNVMDDTDDANVMEQAGMDPGDIMLKFLLMAVQAAANVMDPTWKTPWFMIGPVTPVGIIAKLLSTDWGTDEEVKTDLTKEEEC